MTPDSGSVSANAHWMDSVPVNSACLWPEGISVSLSGGRCFRRDRRRRFADQHSNGPRRMSVMWPVQRCTGFVTAMVTTPDRCLQCIESARYFNTRIWHAICSYQAVRQRLMRSSGSATAEPCSRGATETNGRYAAIPGSMSRMIFSDMQRRGNHHEFSKQ